MTIPHQEHICGPGCQHGASPADEKLIREEFQVARRSFLRAATDHHGVAVSAGAISGAMAPSRAFAQGAPGARAGQGMASHYYIPASASTVLWGYFSRSAKPVVEVRSEEHTSELQSQSNLVCRLLLEKKKKTK